MTAIDRQSRLESCHSLVGYMTRSLLCLLSKSKSQVVSKTMSARARPESSSATASATATASLVKSPPQLPKGSSNRVEKDTSASDIQPADRVNPILDFQDMAPAPSQSFYQIALYPYKKSEARRERRASRASQTSKSPLNKELPELNHEKLERGCIIVREWPRKR